MIGPAGVYSPIVGPIEVRVDGKAIETFGNIVKASAYASGYNAGWHAKQNTALASGDQTS